MINSNKNNYITILLFIVIIFIPLFESTLYFDKNLYYKSISKRQTVVSSNANSTGQGDKVDTNAEAEHYKNSEGVIGVNTSSSGVATGSDQTGVNNQAYGSVGNKEVGAIGNSGATGAESESNSNINAGIHGDQWSVESFQHAKGQGAGDTGAASNGVIEMSNGNVSSPYSSNNTQSSAGATGSLSSSAEIVSSQVLTWDAILLQLVGSAVAQGLYNAQANVDLKAGNANNGIEVNGIVSGDNLNGGLVNAQVNGNANVNNSNHELLGNMYGSVNGTGTSNLVGASNLQSNSSGITNSIQSFGDGKVNSDGNNQITLHSNTNTSNAQNLDGSNGNMIVNSTATGTNSSMTLSGGLKGTTGNDSTMALGDGNIESVGSESSNSSLSVESKFSPQGDGSLIVNGDGQALSGSGNPGSLNMVANGNVSNTDGVLNIGTASGRGTGSGDNVNITGNNFLNINTAGASGNSYMGAQAEGSGNSSASSQANLSINDGNGETRDSFAQGSVSANGDKSKVTSHSEITDNNGVQSLINQQTASSSGKGSSSASASNSGILKKK
uniref:Autotransporter domain-containing protein n=1 Tax=Strongyloides stercoralis TaxID=6248 RepID=A0A0K0EPH6_STRER